MFNARCGRGLASVKVQGFVTVILTAAHDFGLHVLMLARSGKVSINDIDKAGRAHGIEALEFVAQSNATHYCVGVAHKGFIAKAVADARKGATFLPLNNNPLAIAYFQRLAEREGLICDVCNGGVALGKKRKLAA